MKSLSCDERLQKSLPSDQFSNVTFALYCLGDRAYGPNAFCAAGRKLATRLIQLGAQFYCNIGYGDDGTPNGGVFQDLDVWIEKDFLPIVLGFTKNKNEHGMKQYKQKVSHFSSMKSPQSPFRVLFSSSTSSSSSAKVHQQNENKFLDDQTGGKEEWQMTQYQEAYKDFFASLRPATAYDYNTSSGYRISMNNTNRSDGTIMVKTQSTDSNILNSNKDDERSSEDEFKAPLVGHVISNTRITSEDWTQDTRHIKIQVQTSSINPFHQKLQSSPQTPPLPYLAGDIATIMPKNAKSIVNNFISCLPSSIQSKVDLPAAIATNIITSTQYKTNYTQWPPYCTLRGILTYCADISSLPEREDLRSLSAYCNPNHPVGVDQKSKLISLSETSNAALYGDYVIREKRNWADVLFDFDSIRFEQVNENDDDNDDDEQNTGSTSFVPLSIEHLLMILPPIMPRHFSIASSPTRAIIQHGHEFGYQKSNTQCTFDLELCVAVVEGTTPHGRHHKGLCSFYLSQLGLNPGKSSIVRLWIRPGSFNKLPLTPLSNLPSFETPIMCVGAGTGIAPLRSLILEREAVRQLSPSSNKKAEDIGSSSKKVDNLLVFGCRKKNSDYYYDSEWTGLSSNGYFRILTAFSQDQKHKVYVQQIVRDADNGLLVAKHILENGGAVYVAGGAKMARAVKDEIIDCLGKHLPNGNQSAKQLIQKLQRQGKFSIEAWS